MSCQSLSKLHVCEYVFTVVSQNCVDVTTENVYRDIHLVVKVQRFSSKTIGGEN